MLTLLICLPESFRSLYPRGNTNCVAMPVKSTQHLPPVESNKRLFVTSSFSHFEPWGNGCH